MAASNRYFVYKFISSLANLGKMKTLSWRSSHHLASYDPEKIRNFGILAHIDAGKTTTTERMLFYSGKIRAMGEVHDGNTVTDYMEQERNRGITITSASASFPWKDFWCNLVDTPGHIDFTMEVEQALSVIDGAVIILDASAGVEAQTQTVWRQADQYKIPRIVYANKMDRQDASLSLCEETLADKLGATVMVTQLPIIKDKDFLGVVDLVSMEKIIWHPQTPGGLHFSNVPIEESSDCELWKKAARAREKLVDQLSGLDDILAEEVINGDSLENVSSQAVGAAIRRCTILQKGVPLFCGSSYKNRGVQPLMDAVVRYLPSPPERSNRIYSCAFGETLCAQAFKIMHHQQLGPVVFFRVYSGTVTKNHKLYNLRMEQSESCTRVYVATADDFDEVTAVGPGNIAVVAGLNHTRTGDLVTDSAHSVIIAQKALAQSKGITISEAEKLLQSKATVPEPVFFCAVEAPSQGQQVALERALNRLQREDPSLSVNFNDETSQLILGGMGELHLDIIRERLQSEYKLDVLMGQMQIAYRETLKDAVEEEYTSSHAIGSSKQSVHLLVSILPKDSNADSVLMKLSSADKETQSRLNSLSPAMVKALKQGVSQGLSYGPKLNCPLLDASVCFKDVVIGKGTSLTMVAAAASHCVRKALKNADTALMEPRMAVEIVCTEQHLPNVVADLSRRRGSISNIDLRLKTRVVSALVPLAELLGYSSALRIMTSGTASYSMEFLDYQCLSLEQETIVIRRETGMLN